MTTQHTYAPVDHPGVEVPDHLRSWDTPWPDYTPVDITPPELSADALDNPAGWITDPVATPQEVADWSCRLARAVVPYRLDAAGWPLNPAGRTGRSGRDLGGWGENAAADPIVIAGAGDDLQILLIRRGDTGAWAFPGGMVDAGESAQEAALRELEEEAGLDLSGVASHTLARAYVPDRRATDHAWVATTAILYRLPEPVAVVAGDDAVQARWWPLTTAARLVQDLGGDGGLYGAHHVLLGTAVAHLGGRP